MVFNPAVNARPESPPSSAIVRDRVAAGLAAALIVVAVFLAYRGTFAVPFVLDDNQAITDNYSIRHFATAWSPPAETTVTGRPVVNLSLALNYAAGGLAVRGYHAANLAIHLLAALALFGVIRRTLPSPRLPPALAPDATRIAGGVALWWAAHPLQTEAVTYTIQRAESLMGLFYLTTLYAFVRGIGSQRSNDGGPGRASRGWLALSFVACLLGMATKEVMVSAPLLVLLYDRTFVAGSFRDALRLRRGYYAALAATWLVLAALVISAEGRGGTAGLAAKISPLDYALTQCPAIVHYLRLALWPAPLVFDYGHATTTALSGIVAPALLLLALAVGTLVALRTRSGDTAWGKPALGFLGAWFFALLAPSSSVVPVATQTIAEHRMYLPLAAVLTLLVVALHRGLGRRMMLATVSVVAIALAVATNERNATYRDALTLWTDTAAKAPDNPRAVTNLGFALLQQGRVEDAQQLYAAAVQRQPNRAETRINYANALTATGRFDEAVAQLAAALRLEPDNLEAHNNFGITLAQSGRIAEAIPHFERAIQLKPAFADSHRNLGLALAQAGRTDEALAQLAESVRLQPRDPVARDFYGFALLKLHRLPEAIRELEAALNFDPQSARVHNHLGLALSQSDRLAEGRTHLAQAVQLAPDDPTMQNDLGVAIASLGRVDEALPYFERAVQLNPRFAEAERNRAWARAQLSGR